MPDADWQSKRSLTAEEYRALIKELGLSKAGAGRYLGVTIRTAYRYSSGSQLVPVASALLLRSLKASNTKPLVPKYRAVQN